MEDQTDKHGKERLALVGFRFDENSSYLKGTAEAPPLIRDAFFSDSSNLWSESGIDLGAPDTFYDAGDKSPSCNAEMLAEVQGAIRSLLSNGMCPISLGGDHSITYPIIKAMAEKYPKLSILHVDAHPDLYDVLLDNRYSHGCPFARIMEEGLVERLVQVGIRTLNGHQRQQADRFGVEIVEMKNWNDALRFNFHTPIYVSIDIDGIDPAFAPGVSHREPGGLTVRQVVNLIGQLDAKLVGADIVEYNPAEDSSNMTAVVCAKLLKELAAKIIETRNSECANA